MTTRQATLSRPCLPQTQRASESTARIAAARPACCRVGGTMAPRAAGAATARGTVTAAGAPLKPARACPERPQARPPTCSGGRRMAMEAQES